MLSQFGPDQVLPTIGLLGTLSALVMLFWGSIERRLIRAGARSGRSR